MVLENNNRRVKQLLMYFTYLSEVDKLKLGINLLESKYLHLDIDKENAIKLLQRLLNVLGGADTTTIINFSENGTLTFLASKFMELSDENKNKFIFEIMFNVYRTIFISLYN